MIYIMWKLAITLAVLAGWIDWRSRRLPNWLTVAGFTVGIIGNTVLFGWVGVKGALIGAGIPLAVLLPVVLLRGLGAGDWKLMGALGALVGRAEILHVLLATIIIAYLIAVGQMIWQKRANLEEPLGISTRVFIFGLKPHPEFNVNNGGAFNATVRRGCSHCNRSLLGRSHDGRRIFSRSETMNWRRVGSGLTISLIIGLLAGGYVFAQFKKMAEAKSVPTIRSWFLPNRFPLERASNPVSLRLVTWPAAQPVQGMFSRIEDCTNRAVITSLVENEPLLEGKLAPKEGGAGLSTTIPDGMRAVSVSVNDVIGVAGFVVPGTMVDVLVTGSAAPRPKWKRHAHDPRKCACDGRRTKG